MKKDWPLFVCTFALIVTLIGCAYWIRSEMTAGLDAIQIDLEHSNR